MKAIILSLICLGLAGPAQADELQDTVGSLLPPVHKALVSVRLTVRNDMGEEQTFERVGICINAEQGLILIGRVASAIPRSFLKDFTIILPADPEKEIKAEMMGIDYGSGLMYLRAMEKADFGQVQFADKADVRIAQPVFSVGLMSRNMAYKPMVSIVRVAALPDLPKDYIMITGGVFGSEAAPVFDLNGQAIGLTASARLNNAFVPVEEFSYSLKDIPTGGRSRSQPWLGIVRITGLSKGDSQTSNLGNRTAARLSSVIAKGPARKAGVQEMDYLVAIDGDPLRSYLNPDMIGQDVFAQVARKKVGEVVELTIVRDGKEEKVPVTLEAVPMVAAEAPRVGVQELGLGLRDLVFLDRYRLELPDSQKGVILHILPKNSPAARDLVAGDVIIAVNGVAVTDVTSFGQLMTAAMADSSPYVTMKVLRPSSTNQAEEKTVRVRKG